MALTIELKVNGRLIGGAIITNRTGLADVSDYEVDAVETASPASGHELDFRSVFKIAGHSRRQSVWALVAKVAAGALERRETGKYDQEPPDRDGV